MSERTFADLRVHFGTGRAYTISGKGRDRVMGYRVGMKCNLGDIDAELKPFFDELGLDFPFDVEG